MPDARPRYGTEGTDCRSVPSAVGSEADRPELSVIIPTRNEAGTLPELLHDLAVQSGVALEVLISDGASTDGTRAIAQAALGRLGLPGLVLPGPAGRGRQLNAGAAAAAADWLLFLHADSRLPDQQALRRLLDEVRGGGRKAGRFTLRFDLPAGRPPFGYYLAEVKARLDLPGTIHGDQGMLLAHAYFLELGGFREDLPVLEDTLLAEAVRRNGGWIRCAAPILTSPRRFQVEGFRQRQTLNALLMAFAAIGWDEILRELPDLYRAQDCARILDLAPFFRRIDQCLQQLPRRQRWRTWRRIGAYVRANAWQLALRRAARRGYAAGRPPEAVALQPVLRFRRFFDVLAGHSAGNLAATVLTWLWFRRCCRQPPQGE